MPLYAIRHGETALNAQRIYNGTLDEPLSAVGEEQARAAAASVAAVPFDQIICSPLSRTRRTCELVNANHVPVLYDARLMEREMGSLTSQPYSMADGRRIWSYHSDYSEGFAGLESMDSVIARARSVVEELREKYAGRTVLLVTHGGFIRALRSAVDGIPENGELADFPISKNCELSFICNL